MPTPNASSSSQTLVRFRLPDPPERHPDEVTSYKYVHLLGNSMHLAKHLGRAETTIVGAELYLVAHRGYRPRRVPDLMIGNYTAVLTIGAIFGTISVEEIAMTTRYQAPGRADRKGLSLKALFRMFPDDAAAERWFEQQMWPNGPVCPDCGSQRYSVVGGKHRMPYHCKDCRQYFSVRKGSLMHDTKLGYQTWAIAVYQFATSLKGVSAMKLHRDLGITYKSAWHLLHRIRKAFESDDNPFDGPVEIDETYIGGRERNKHQSKKLKAGRGTVGKTAVVGAKDRKSGKVKTRVVKRADKLTLHGFVHDHVALGAQLYTDEHPAYRGARYHHQAVRHSAGEYVDGQAHINGVESFWSLMKRGLIGIYHHVSVKHLDRYVCEFAGRHNIRDLGTEAQMGEIARGMMGKRLRYADLTA